MRIRSPEEMLDVPAHELACQILEKAIDDYRFLKNNKLDDFKIRGWGEISIKEIEKFLQSSWCDGLLESISSKLTGKEIMYYLRLEYRQKEVFV
jgi:hypothetical protein